MPASIQYNNPGAINGNAKWVQECAGFLRTVVIGGGNPIAVFDTAEHGLMCYYKLLQMYRRNGYVTLQQIVNRYGGGQDYSAYVSYVCIKTKLEPEVEIKLTGGDVTLLKFCKAMFQYEAGTSIPWTDMEILHAFDSVRGPAPHDKPIYPAPGVQAPTTNPFKAILDIWRYLMGNR